MDVPGSFYEIDDISTLYHSDAQCAMTLLCSSPLLPPLVNLTEIIYAIYDPNLTEATKLSGGNAALKAISRYLIGLTTVKKLFIRVSNRSLSR